MKEIKKILVPTDFSENARTAYEYAIDLAEQFNAKIDVVHVYSPIDDGLPLVYPDKVSSLKLKEQLTDFVSKSIENDDDDGYISLRKVKVNAELLFGNVTNTLVDLSKNTYDLIVMGSLGGGSFAEIVFGSVTTKVAQEAHCPVLVIPHNRRYHKVEHLTYACDFKHKSFKHPALVADVAHIFKAKINMLYVQHLGENQEPDKIYIEDMLAVFKTEAPQLSVTAHIVDDDDVFEGINQFTREYQTDMVVLITKHHSLIQKFLHPSVTKEMAMYTNLPLLILKEV